MKCPIPSDAKFSPVFQEVSPATVPPHSFCQTLRPIRMASSCDRETAAETGTQGETKRATVTTELIVHDRTRKESELRPLDENPFPVDEFSAAGRGSDRPHLNSLKQFMKTSPLIVAASIAVVSLAPAA